MDTQSSLGPTALLAHIVSDIADALAGRPGESQARADERARTAAGTILQFRPGDAVEAMISGHCVIFHELIVDGVQDTLRAEDGKARRVTRSAIVAMDRAFGANLTRLERYRAGAAAARAAADKAAADSAAADSQPAPALAETEIADRVLRHRPDMPFPARADERAVSAEPGEAACQAGSAADPDQPAEALLASAAGRLAGLNRQARREFGRQARKRLGAAA
jgi:hypothetical protein